MKKNIFIYWVVCLLLIGFIPQQSYGDKLKINNIKVVPATDYVDVSFDIAGCNNDCIGNQVSINIYLNKGSNKIKLEHVTGNVGNFTLYYTDKLSIRWNLYDEKGFSEGINDNVTFTIECTLNNQNTNNTSTVVNKTENTNNDYKYDNNTNNDYYNNKKTNYDNEPKNTSGFDLGILVGYWSPQGDVAILGAHPCFGLLLGYNFNNFSFDANCNARTGNATSNYGFYKGESIKLSNDYGMALNFGMDVGIKLFRIGVFEMDLLGGVCYETFTATASTTSVTEDFETINYNFGIGSKFHFGIGRNIGLQFKCNIIDYQNTSSEKTCTALDGYAYTFNFIYNIF